MSDPERPYYHVAPINGKPTVFASLEFQADKPPKTIEVDGHTWTLDKDGKR